MNPQNPLPPASNQPSPYQIPQVPAPQQYPPLAPAPPARPARSKKPLVVIVLVVVLLLGVAAGAWFLTNNKKKAEPKSTPVATTSQEQAAPDKQGIQKAVDAYCQELGKAFGFQGMDSGYIISERFSEEMLSDSPELLRFKQVGDAAAATVDCEDSEGPNGLSNDLLFVKQNGTWSYVDEVQNNSGTGFACSKVDQHKVSKELVSKCAPSQGAETQPR